MAQGCKKVEGGASHHFPNFNFSSFTEPKHNIVFLSPQQHNNSENLLYHNQQNKPDIPRVSKLTPFT